MEPSAPLYARGAYRVLAPLPCDGPGPRPYRVVDTAGSGLREEADFDAARAWVDTRVGAAERPVHRRRRR